MEFSLTLIAVALSVLCVVGILILKELRRGSRANEVPLAGAGGRPETGDPEVTLVGTLPRLSSGLESTDDGTPSSVVTLFEQGVEFEESTASKKLFIVFSAGGTDRGQTRKRNEDSILLLAEKSIFVIADGMGGYAGGDVASKLAVDVIGRCFTSGAPASDALPAYDGRRPRRAVELVRAIEAANTAIRAEARRRPELDGMGSTLVGARFLENSARAYISYIGDSRCYRFRGGTLRLLTTDHTLAAKGIDGPMAANLRRALGIRDRIAVDLCIDKPQPDDVYVLCSDGLNKMIDDAQIAQVLETHPSDLDAAVGALIDEANKRGGRDNISVVLVGIHAAPDAAA